MPNKLTFFSSKPYDKTAFQQTNAAYGLELEFFETHLGPHIVNAIDHTDAVCVFVNDKVNAEVIGALAAKQVKVIALRCAGFNNVDLEAAKQQGIKVCRVPAYSPEAVAEHAVAMIMTLNRKTHKAYNRVREQNFSLNGLMGFDLHGKTVGIIGTGNIGKAFAKIMIGFGCRVLAFDLIANKELEALGVEYLPLLEILQQADIVSLHCPLNEQTHHLINADTLAYRYNPDVYSDDKGQYRSLEPWEKTYRKVIGPLPGHLKGCPYPSPEVLQHSHHLQKVREARADLGNSW